MKLHRTIAALAALAWPVFPAGPALAATLPATPATFQAVLKAAQAGDVVALSGSAGRIDVAAAKAGEVTIASADPANPARIGFLNIKASANLTFRGLEIAMPGGGQGVRVTASQGIKLDALDIHGVLDGDPTSDGTGMLIEDSREVAVSGSRFHDLTSGIGHARSDGVAIAGNDFRLLRVDGIAGADSNRVTIRDNRFRDFYPLAADHADIVQFWQVAPGGVQTDLVVEGNVYERGAGRPSQGVFMTASQGGYRNVRIVGNAMIGAMYHGITTDKVAGLTVTDNLVQGLDDQTSRVSWIMVTNSPGAVVSANRATGYGPNGIDYKAGGNVLLGALPVGSEGGLALWLTRHDDPRDAAIAGLTADLAAQRDAAAVLAAANATIAADRAALAAKIEAAQAALR